jgi:hypothetical protein
MTIKILFIHFLYNLSDPELEEQIESLDKASAYVLWYNVARKNKSKKCKSHGILLPNEIKISSRLWSPCLRSFLINSGKLNLTLIKKGYDLIQHPSEKMNFLALYKLLVTESLLFASAEE